jgi:hypothetical protein
MLMHIVKRRNPTYVRFTLGLVSALLAATTTGPVSAASLATFESHEIMGREWALTLVTYPVEFKPGQARPREVRLVDAQGREQDCQFWRVKLHPDGSIATGRVSFYAALPKGGHFRYNLETSKPAPAGIAPKATVERTGGVQGGSESGGLSRPDYGTGSAVR